MMNPDHRIIESMILRVLIIPAYVRTISYVVLYKKEHFEMVIAPKKRSRRPKKGAGVQSTKKSWSKSVGFLCVFEKKCD